MTDRPSGTVTFLFADIEGSTKLAQESPNHLLELSPRRHSHRREQPLFVLTGRNIWSDFAEKQADRWNYE